MRGKLTPFPLGAAMAGAALVGLSAVACARSELPDPRDAALAYAHAAEQGKSSAIYAMLTRRAQTTYGRDGVRALVADTKSELGQSGRALSSKASNIETSARVRFADGEQAELTLEQGAFRIASAGALPTGARTPVQALAELRAALARRSYAGLLRVLTSETKSGLENDMRSLVDGLEEPETLDVKISGDRAEVRVPGGHVVKLKREAGVWRVEDFD